MRKFFTCIALFILCCCSTHLNTRDAVAEDGGPKKIKLGAIVPLSGPLAFFGKDYVRAYEIAVEENPSIRDHIDVVWEDSAYDSKKAVSAFSKLVEVDKVDIILSFGGPMLSALAPLAEARGVPFFATESDKSDCAGKQFCSLFRNEEDDWGRATWAVLRKSGKKKIGFIKNENTFMNTFVNAVIRTKGADESAEVLVNVTPDTVDMRSTLLSIKNKDVDALGVYLLPGSHVGFLTAYRNLNKKIQLFGVEEFLVKEHNANFGNLIDGTLVIAPGYIESYRTKFEKLYGYSAGFFYTPAFYDFLVLLKDTVIKESDARGLNLVKAMHFSGERTGVSGKYSVKVAKNGVYSYSFPIFEYKISGDSVLASDIKF